MTRFLRLTGAVGCIGWLYLLFNSLNLHGWLAIVWTVLTGIGITWGAEKVGRRLALRKSPRHVDFTEANSVYRKIVRWEPDLPEIQFLVLECGHKVPIVVHRLTDCRCDICTNEVEQLRQMAGTK